MSGEILDALAHDLCTPLASIKVAVSGLRETDVDWTPDQVRELLAIIEDGADRLNLMIRQLLDSSRLRGHAMVARIQPVAVVDVVSQAIARFGNDGPAVVVDVDDELFVQGDPGLLSHVLTNLIGNALKYAGSCGVRVAAAPVDDRVHVRVVDDGPGIPHTERETVLRRFTQLDRPSSARSGGVGLGLAIADGFVRAMAGSIKIGDTPGGGTTMTVDLAKASSLDR